MVWQNPPDETGLDKLAGFVYTITNNITGCTYVGKKYFWHIRHRKLKGQRKKKRYINDSGWRDYTGSSDELNEDIAKYGIENFTFRIVEIFRTRREVDYAELKLQVELDVLYAKDEKGEYKYYNKNILRHFYR